MLEEVRCLRLHDIEHHATTGKPFCDAREAHILAADFPSHVINDEAKVLVNIRAQQDRSWLVEHANVEDGSPRYVGHGDDAVRDVLVAVRKGESQRRRPASSEIHSVLVVEHLDLLEKVDAAHGRGGAGVQDELTTQLNCREQRHVRYADGVDAGTGGPF